MRSAPASALVLAGRCSPPGAPRRRWPRPRNLRAAKQYGLGYVQFMIMEDMKLVEKHAKAAGLGDIEVTGTRSAPPT